MAVDTKLVGSDGKTITTPRLCSLCRCGESVWNRFATGHTHRSILSESAKIQTSRNWNFIGARTSPSYSIATFDWAQDTAANSRLFSAPTTNLSMNPTRRQSRISLPLLKSVLPGPWATSLETNILEIFCSETKIVVEKDGPLNCQGEITLIDDQDSDAFLPVYSWQSILYSIFIP